MNTEIKHNVFFKHSPADVWEYLTNPEMLSQWLMKNDLKAEVGNEFHFWHSPMPAYGFDGTVYCKVLEIIPMEKFVYSWKGGPEKGVLTLDSVVEWTLHPRDGGTELRLVHTGFESDAMGIYPIMDAGWLKNMNEINTKLNAVKDGTTTV